MLETIVVICVAAWLLGYSTNVMLGGALHILLVLACVVMILRFLQGRPL